MIQIDENLYGITAKGNIAIALRWNRNLETWNKEAQLNPFWFRKKIDWQAWVEDWKRRLLDFIEGSERWDIWEGSQVGFASLDLINEGNE